MVCHDGHILRKGEKNLIERRMDYAVTSVIPKGWHVRHY